MIHNIELAGLATILPTLPCQGILRLIDEHYLYLDISDDYIYLLQPLLTTHVDEAIVPPNYFTVDKNNIGAHISVMYPDEKACENVTDILGSTISFTTQAIVAADIDTQRYYALSIQSPELFQIRQQHDLPNPLTFKGVDIGFHITLGVCALKS